MHGLGLAKAAWQLDKQVPRTSDTVASARGSSVPSSSALATSKPTLVALHRKRWTGTRRVTGAAAGVPKGKGVGTGACAHPAAALVAQLLLLPSVATPAAGQSQTRHSLRCRTSAPVAWRAQVVVGFQEQEAEPLNGVEAQQRVQPDLQPGRHFFICHLFIYVFFLVLLKKMHRICM